MTEHRRRYVDDFELHTDESGGETRGHGWLAAGLAVGVAVGLIGWSLHQRRSRRALFHARPVHRLAALGYLRAHPSVDSARLLRDYLQWEPHSLLRRHARRVLRRTERSLRS